MPSTGRAGTIGGVNADSLMHKSFFAANNRLPKKVIREDLHVFPSRDFTNLNGATLTAGLGEIKITGHASNRYSNLGWNFGASYGKALIITGLNRQASWAMATAMWDTAPTDGPCTGRDGYYLFYSTQTGRFELHKNGTTLEDIADTPGVALYPNGTNMMMALYYCKADAVLEGYVRFGAENWLRLFARTESSFNTMSAAGWFFDAQSNLYKMFAGMPLGIYAE